MTSELSNQQLYSDCLHEGSPAQHAAFELLWRYLYRIAFAMLQSRRDTEALATDCTQIALIKLHRNLAQCNDPEHFRSWAAQIVRRTVIDTLRQPAHRHQTELVEEHANLQIDPPTEPDDLHTFLLQAIQQAPLSDRSRRVVLGRFFAEQPDEILAAQERVLSNEQVLPSHIQVTRAKNLAKLRQQPLLLEQLRDYLSN